MSDLDRLLDISMWIDGDTNEKLQQEYESLKAKIEGKIEKGDKFDVLNEVFEDYPKGWLDMKEDLESQVARLEKQLQKYTGKCIDYQVEVAKLKEELVYLKELNNGLDYCAEQESIKSKQLKSTLDEIAKYCDKEFDTYSFHRKNLNEILAKHEDKK
jgi:SMC interacting uncharacterized protein involved in chromosome segregation